MKNQNALRDKIVSCICAMDVRMLDVLLPEYGIYEGTYKEVWLEKLSSFFKMCKLMGDTVLTVSQKRCVGGHYCECGQKMWLFESGNAGKGFAIYFEMDGDEIKGIGRCFGHYTDDLNMTYSYDAFDFEAFYVYCHEKIGFIDTNDFKTLRKNVQLFMADITNPRRHTIGVIGVKRMIRKYNRLYFDVREVPHLFEYRIEMMLIYEDLFSLRNIFSQQKSFEKVIKKCNELMQYKNQKGKVQVMKWLLQHEAKVKNYLVFHNELHVEPKGMIYEYQVDGVSHKLVIRHPKIQMDVEAYRILKTYVKQFYSYLFDRFLKDYTFYEYMESKCAMYHHFKDQMDDVVGEFEDRVGGMELNHSCEAET
jgi:hypothetical protein